jgi:hypothetical protein
MGLLLTPLFSGAWLSTSPNAPSARLQFSCGPPAIADAYLRAVCLSCLVLKGQIWPHQADQALSLSDRAHPVTRVPS